MVQLDSSGLTQQRGGIFKLGFEGQELSGEVRDNAETQGRKTRTRSLFQVTQAKMKLSLAMPKAVVEPQDMGGKK